MTVTKKQFLINFFAASIGNTFEHYDKALFALLAPFLAPVFFGNHPPLTALISTYAILFFGFISKPAGALVLGCIGDRKGRRIALHISLIGMALTTFFTGHLPTSTKIEWIAPALLACSRLLQNFFSSGETTGGALLILETGKQNRSVLHNSFYECSTILGILLASTGVIWLAMQGTITTQWRWLYWIGGGTGGVAFFIRFFSKETHITSPPKWHMLPFIWNHRLTLVIIVITSGLSYSNYYMATTLLNGYLPFINSITQLETMQLNSFILVLDFLLLPLGGLLSIYFAKEKLLLFFASSICAVAIPLYSILPIATLVPIIIIRSIFVILGVGFSVILVPYYQDLVPKKHRYTLISLGTAIGSQLFGNSSYLSLLLFKNIGWPGAPALYLMTIALLTIITLIYVPNKVLPKKTVVQNN